MTKQYAFYPGCSSQLRGSASNYLTSVNSMCKTLDIKLTEIPDWNCCGASVSYAGSGEVARHAMNARNFALAEKHLPGQEMVATCAACWLNARETQHQLAEDRKELKEYLLGPDEPSSIEQFNAAVAELALKAHSRNLGQESRSAGGAPGADELSDQLSPAQPVPATGEPDGTEQH